MERSKSLFYFSLMQVLIADATQKCKYYTDYTIPILRQLVREMKIIKPLNTLIERDSWTKSRILTIILKRIQPNNYTTSNIYI